MNIKLLERENGSPKWSMYASKNIHGNNKSRLIIDIFRLLLDSVRCSIHLLCICVRFVCSCSLNMHAHTRTLKLYKISCSWLDNRHAHAHTFSGLLETTGREREKKLKVINIFRVHLVCPVFIFSSVQHPD